MDLTIREFFKKEFEDVDINLGWQIDRFIASFEINIGHTLEYDQPIYQLSEDIRSKMMNYVIKTINELQDLFKDIEDVENLKIQNICKRQ